jgi:hypothetical protein
VILFHGIARTSRSLGKLDRTLRQAGFATLNLDYPSRRKTGERFTSSAIRWAACWRESMSRGTDRRSSALLSCWVRRTGHITVKASHNGLLRHRIAIDQTIAFLREGRFKSA